VYPPGFARRAVLTFFAAGAVAYAITMFAQLVLATAVHECTWPADSGEPLPPCPPGLVPTGYLSLGAGIVGVIVWAKWGLRIGPRLIFFVWSAFHLWWIVPQFPEKVREDGWGVVLVLLEAGAFALWPLFLLFSNDVRHNVFWSDGAKFFPNQENPPPPTPPAEPRLKVWSLAVQLAAIALGVAFGFSVFATLPRPG
jgi:hypothetical protein